MTCMATTNWQEGRVECVGDPMGAEPVRVVITEDSDAAVVVPDTETINVGDMVTIQATGDRLKSQTTFEIRQGSVVLQMLSIHTSCSKPLEVGDQFGSMVLRQMIVDD